MMSFRSAATLVALAGCSESSPPPQTEPTTRSITARDAFGWRAVDGATVEVPVDLDAAVVQAYAQDDAGAWTVYGGEGTSAGTLSVGDAPEGPAWLRVDYFDPSPEAQPRNEYFAVDTEQRSVELDLGTWRAGRASMQYATKRQTVLGFEITGLEPWQPGWDLFNITAPDLGFTQVFYGELEGITGIPTEGATASTLRAAWASAVGGPLFDAAAGDRAFALQMRFRQIGDSYVGAPVRAATLAPFSLPDGGLTMVTTPMTTLSPLKVQVAMDRPAFDRYMRDVGPFTGGVIGRGFNISAAASDVTQSFSERSIPSELVVIDGEGIHGSGPFDLGPLDVMSPFPASHVFGRFVTAYGVRIPRDDGFLAEAQAEIGVITNALPAQGAPARPIISPVRNITVSGIDIGATPRDVGLTPVLRWEAPTLGTPVRYEVKILAPGGTDPRYGFGWYPSAIFHVPATQTSLELPPEVLEPDLPYALAIRAITHAAPSASSPRQLALPYGWADSITPAFYP